MIDRQQIAEALRRLDPRDREILDYSLRRRVPDEDLAALFDSEPAEVARRRAGAIEALSADLGVQRGADLGHILKELLEGDTWDAAEEPSGTAAIAEPATPPEPGPAGSGAESSHAAGDHPPLGASPSQPAGPPQEAEAEPPEPVLGMLSEERPPATDAGPGRPSGPRSPTRRRIIIGVAAAAAVLVPAGMVAALATGGGDPGRGTAGPSQATREFAPARKGSAEPFPSDPQSAEQYPVARVKKRTALYSKPGGKLRVRISPKTEWNSPRILSVVERRGRWLAVIVPELKNGQQAWVREDKVADLSSVTWALRVDLSKRTLVVRHSGRTVRKMKIGVGRPDHPTPQGRFAVTDKLRVSDPGSPYGCCVLALTGHQTRLPAGWPGGDRLAVHATRDLSGLGKRVSLGCMRTDPRDTKWMMKRVPLGTPVFVDA